MGMLDSLNQRQKKFVNNYFKGLNATRSCIEAGYSSNAATASVTGYRLLRNAKVVNAIQYLNEMSGISPDSVVSNLVSVFNQKNNSVKTKASDIIKISNLFFKIWGLDLSKSGTRRLTRNKRRPGVGSISYSPDNFFKQNGDTYNKEVIEEDSPLKIELAVPKSIPKAVPMEIPKATSRPGEMRNPVAAYSLSNFKEKEEVNTSHRVFYPA